MKKTAWLLLTLMVFPLHAQSLLGTLNQHQDSLEPSSGSGGTPTKTTPGPEVVTTGITTSSGNEKCEEPNQTSMPLSYLTSLMQSRNAKLEVQHDPRKGTLEISAPPIIGNCRNMVSWEKKDQVIKGRRAYSLELKFVEGENCDADGCNYKVAKVEGTSFKGWMNVKLKPNLNGFEDCLKQSGVIEGGRVKKDAIYSEDVSKKFDGVYESGDLLFVSHGPISSQVKAKHGKFVAQDRCDFYEVLDPAKKQVVSLEDEERSRLAAEAKELEKCSINEYHKVADFIEKYQDYADSLSGLRDKLILEASKKAAKAIESGKYTEEDLKVMADFERYIVQPKIEKARDLYLELRELEGAEADLKKAQLKEALAELKSLNSKPYFQTTHTKRLVHDGRFDEAEKMNSIKLTLDTYSKLGSKQNNVVITPEVAFARVSNGREQFLNDLENEKERYALRTGQTSGKEAYYRMLAKSMRGNIEVRTQNFNDEIREEYMRMQPGGYCYKYFRNTQKCIQDSMERIQELQALLKHYNQVDAERAVEYDEKAEEYGKLEAEGRRYVAAQNGEEIPEEKPAEQPAVDTTVPSKRTDNGNYSFNYNPQQMQQFPQQQQQFPQQQNPFMMGYQGGMFQQPSNPFQMYGGGYQQPFMGQQAFGGFGGGYGGYGGYQSMGGYNFQWGGGGQQPQGMGGYSGMGGYGGYGGFAGNTGFGLQGQSGFWGQPYPAYNMYSMYGR